MLTKHKDCLSINGKQSVKLQEGIIEFENYFKQIPVPFKHLKFMLILSVIWKKLKAIKVLTQKNIKITFLVVLLTKLFALMTGLLRQLLFLEVKMLLMNLLKQFLKSMSTVKK